MLSFTVLMNISRKKEAVEFIYYYDKQINSDQYYYNTQIHGPLDMSMFTPSPLQSQAPQFIAGGMEPETEEEEEETQPTGHEFGGPSQSLFPDESQIQRQFAQSRKTKIDNELERYSQTCTSYFATCKYFTPMEYLRIFRKNLRFSKTSPFFFAKSLFINNLL